MKVTLDFQTWTCRVTKTQGDPRFTSSNWSDDESVFLYHVKQELIKQGYDVIKKRMWKDGHLVDSTQQYIRSRNDNKKGSFYIFNDRYAIVSAGAEFNKLGEFDLYLVPLTD